MVKKLQKFFCNFFLFRQFLMHAAPTPQSLLPENNFVFLTIKKPDYELGIPAYTY